MSDNEIRAIIAEIATKHGIALDKNDPILILNTINQRLIENGTKAQQNLLHSFKQDIEITSHRWASDAKKKAEDILNAALAAGKKQLSDQVSSASKEATDTVKREMNQITTKLDTSVRSIQKLIYLAITTSFLTLIAATIVLFTRL